MSHKTFKVSIIIDDSVENFYIKHYVGKNNRTENNLSLKTEIEMKTNSEQKKYFFHLLFADDFQPIFNKFKSLVFQRNPSVNSPILKIYWIGKKLLLLKNFIIFRLCFVLVFCVVRKRRPCSFMSH